MTLRQQAEKLFEEYGHCAHVAQTHELGKRKYIDAHDAEGLKKFKQREQERSVDLYERSLETARKLDLPEDRFYDLYFSKDAYKSNNLISGMRPESAMAIVEYRGYTLKPALISEQECRLEMCVDGISATFSLTKDEACEFPHVKESLADPESKWARNFKGALLNEAVKMIVKGQFLRVFTPKSKSVQAFGEDLSNQALAKKILVEQIYNIEDCAFDAIDFLKASKELLKTASEREQRAIMNQVREKGLEIRSACIHVLTQGLELCERLKLPKETFFGISTRAELMEIFSLSNLKQKWILDILYQMGHVLMIEKMSRQVCRIRLEIDGDSFVEELRFSDIKDKADIQKHMDTSGKFVESDHFIVRRTELKLFFELVKEIVKKHYRRQFLLPERKPRRAPVSSRFNLDLETLLAIEEEATTETPNLDKPPVDPIDLEVLEESLIEKVTNEAMNFVFEDEEETQKPTEKEKEQFKQLIDAHRYRLKKIFDKEPL